MPAEKQRRLPGFLLPALQGEGVPGPSPARRPENTQLLYSSPKHTQLGAGIAQVPAVRHPFAGRRQGPAGLSVSPAGGADAAGVIGMLQLTSLSSLIRSSHMKLLFVSCCHTAGAAFNSSSPGAAFPRGCREPAPGGRAGMDGTMSGASSRMQDATLHACREQGGTHKAPSAQHPFINYLMALNEGQNEPFCEPTHRLRPTQALQRCCPSRSTSQHPAPINPLFLITATALGFSNHSGPLP